MIDKKEFKKMAKKILRSDKGVVNPKLMHPAREWGIGITVGLIILVVSMVWSAEVYLSYRDTNFDEVANENEVIVYRASLVENTLALFTNRADYFADLLSNSTQPSLFENDLSGQDVIIDEVSTTSIDVEGANLEESVVATTSEEAIEQTNETDSEETQESMNEDEDLGLTSPQLVN